MAIPDYETFMRPALQVLADGQAHRPAEIAALAADELKVSAADRELLLPSGRTPYYRSRAGWALTYMKQAGLVLTQKRGVYEITDRGRMVLGQNPDRLDNDVLDQFEEFREFRQRARAERNEEQPSESLTPTSTLDAPPEEALELATSTLREALVTQLIDTLKTVSPSRFEVIVVDVLQAMGYGSGRPDAARAVGRSGDGGIDGVLDEDRLGLDTVYVQAKRWEGTVGRPVVQAFAGALQGRRATKGVMITTSDFTRDAQTYIGQIGTRIVLVNGRRLAELMVDHNVGVSVQATFTVKRLDSDYFEE
ncbi:MAG: restriction endonuclease [Gammaproteobacteria bacterium]